MLLDCWFVICVEYCLNKSSLSDSLSVPTVWIKKWCQGVLTKHPYVMNWEWVHIIKLILKNRGIYNKTQRCSITNKDFDPETSCTFGKSRQAVVSAVGFLIECVSSSFSSNKGDGVSFHFCQWSYFQPIMFSIPAWVEKLCCRKPFPWIHLRKFSVCIHTPPQGAFPKPNEKWQVLNRIWSSFALTLKGNVAIVPFSYCSCYLLNRDKFSLDNLLQLFLYREETYFNPRSVSVWKNFKIPASDLVFFILSPNEPWSPVGKLW